jgi:CMP-N-acetylneuraminic acid synthetase
MLDYFAENRSKSFELLSNESPLLDETIFKKIYHLFINKEIVTNSRQKSQFYINDGSRKQNNEEKIIQDATGILISSNESTDSDTENNYVLAA